jgi:hypothetical protein
METKRIAGTNTREMCAPRVLPYAPSWHDLPCVLITSFQRSVLKYIHT